jgi:polar amino acid transport system substrate-binding protein
MIQMKKRINSSIQSLLVLMFLLTYIPPVFSIEKKSFSIGWDPWMPYQHIDKNNRLTGLDIELIQSIFSDMGCTLEYKQVPWKQLLPAVKRGQISLAAGASKSLERMAYAYFSNAYRIEAVVLFVRKGETKAIKHISDIIGSDLKIGILKGNYYGQTFEKLMKNKNFKEHIQLVSADQINITKTLNKRIDGFLCDKYAGISEINRIGAFNRFDIHPNPISSSDIHLMFSKKTCKPIDVNRFNDSLKKLKKNGTLNQIIHKYFQ